MFGSTAPDNATHLTNGCNDYLLFLALEPPDLPVKQPDLDITAVYKLASGIQGSASVSASIDLYDATRSSLSIK
jgi:hypothetical protein